MLTTEQINDLHRLHWSEHWPIRKIDRQLHMGWPTRSRSIWTMPAHTPAARPRASKLDSVQAHHRRTAGKGSHRQRRRDRAAAAPAGLYRWRQHSAALRA